MIHSSKNTIGNVSGNYNRVIQVILSGGEEIAEKLGVLIEQLVTQEKKEIEALRELIASKTEIIGDKAEIIGLKNNEIVQLKTALVEKQQQLDENEQRFATLLLENDGKDFTGSQELYPKAVEALMKGNKEEALKILNRHSLLEEKRKLDSEKQQQADGWFLRADLLKSENTWGEELNECYTMAVDTLSNWSTNLKSGNHFQFINDFSNAQTYYQISLQKAVSDEEKAATLNNLAVLQRAKNEFDKAEASYEEALSMRRELTSLNPQTYLPDVGTTLNNLGNLQRAKNEFEKAEASYEEALEIYRELARLNPQTYLPDVGMTLINMGIYYKESKVDKELSIQLTDEAITLLLPFSDIGYIQNYLKVAFNVLRGWNIDVEAYLEEKMKSLNINEEE
ncbi:tetratricopeptide repeat protein [Dokdonia sp.]|uniref:tetratricopeptide repeat protein n=1 Tax=Dokdonia sp. TaxID=2024995 RepID=UPI00326691AA